jgi:hypothetical protein
MLNAVKTQAAFILSLASKNEALLIQLQLNRTAK